MKSHNSERGTTFRSVRHRGGGSVEVEHATPERSLEKSLTAAKGLIKSEKHEVDNGKETSFTPSPEREAGDRIGSDHDMGRGQPMSKEK